MWELANAIAQGLVYPSALAATGAGVFPLIFGPLSAAETRRIRAFTWTCAGLGIVASAALIPIRAGFLSGTGLAGMFTPYLLELLAISGLGASVAARCLGLLTLIAGSWRLTGRNRPLVAAGTLLVAASFPLTGHATTHGPYPATSLALTIHVAAVAFWIGSLYPLMIISRSANPRLAATVLDRFGRVAAYVVPTLIAAGIALAAIMLEHVSDLWTSDYGRLLGLKLIGLTALLGLAALNKLRLVPLFAQGDARSGHRLRQSIRGEMLAALLILAATAALTGYTAPTAGK